MGGGGPPEACALVCTIHAHEHKQRGGSRTRVNRRACSSPQVGSDERSPWQPDRSTSGVPAQHQSQSRGSATGSQRCLKDGRPHGYGQLSCPVWGPGSRNATAKSIIPPSWAGGRLRGLSHYLAIDPNLLLRD